MTDQAEAPAGRAAGAVGDARRGSSSEPPPTRRARRARQARRTGARRRGPWASFAREVALVLVGALVLSWVVKTFLVQAFFIPSSSMHDTLVEGDRVVVSKLAPGPFALHRGDVVVFADPGTWLTGVDVPHVSTLQDALAAVGLAPQSQDHLIKRVVGLPGDHVVSAGDGSPITVNGVAVDESRYLAAGASPSESAFDVEVPADALWVLGDNRQHSLDSRRHVSEPGGGFLPVDLVVGTAFATVWPLDRMTLLRNPGDVFADVPDPR